MNVFKIAAACFLLFTTFTVHTDASNVNLNSMKASVAQKALEPSMRDIRLMLNTAGLGKYWGVLKPHIRTGFYMTPTMMDEGKIKIGTSKIGGRPDVPANFKWPYWNKHPMSFLAQINLKEFPMASVHSGYPTSGILYFFYVYDPELWYDNKSYDADKSNNNVVFYTAETSKLVRMVPPKALQESQIFKSSLIERKMELTIPDGDYLLFNNLIKNKEDLEKYNLEFRPKFMETYNRGIGFRFLGHMTPLQYGGHPSDEILLFQADSDNELGMDWDLSGLLYFFMKEADFEKLFFDNVYTTRVGT